MMVAVIRASPLQHNVMRDPARTAPALPYHGSRASDSFAMISELREVGMEAGGVTLGGGRGRAGSESNCCAGCAGLIAC